MANSNRRDKASETVHHLVSRIAHRVYFLEESERMDFLGIVRRVAEFSGIRLIGWCVMANHFHLMVYLPSPVIVDEPEVLRRHGVLKGAAAAERMALQLASWRKTGASGDKLVEEWLARQRRRMYDVGEFMKTVKQWFTEEYNKRHSHKGTLWEAAYYDRVVKRTKEGMSKCLGYIHLNPIRAAAADCFDGYAWSSYSAFRKGDPTAIAGMRFIYGVQTPEPEIAEDHELLLEALLEEEKLRRAGEIARKRAAGYDVPHDPLTEEALIAQRAARLAEVQKESMELRGAWEVENRRREKGELREKEVLALLAANPEMDVPLLAERLKTGLSMAYLIVGRLKKRGLVERDRRSGRWLFPNIGIWV